jgi:hypothetical protein
MSGGRELLRLQFVDLARGSTLGLDGVNKHDVVITQKGLQQKQPPMACLGHGDAGIREPFANLLGHTNPHSVITED